MLVIIMSELLWKILPYKKITRTYEYKWDASAVLFLDFVVIRVMIIILSHAPKPDQ